MSTNLFCGENRRDEEEGKKSSNKAERGDKAPTRNALALSQLSLCVCCCFQSRPLSLFNLSPFVSCGGKQQSVDTLNKEEAKKLEHKSRGVKKHEHRNCSLNLRSFLSVLFSLSVSLCFFVQTLRLFHQKSVEISSVSQRRSAFPHYYYKHLRLRWRLRKPFTSKRSSAT